MSNQSDLWTRASKLLGFECFATMPVVMTAECSGADHTDDEWTTPVGAPGILTDVELFGATLAITVAIYCCGDPKDRGVKNIVNVFEETDDEPRFPFVPAILTAEVTGAADAPFARPIAWSREDQNAALAEGWYLDEEDGNLVADDDDVVFADDAAAFDFVREKATNGDERAIRAVLFDLVAAVDAWAGKLPPMARPMEQPAA